MKKEDLYNQQRQAQILAALEDNKTMTTSDVYNTIYGSVKVTEPMEIHLYEHIGEILTTMSSKKLIKRLPNKDGEKRYAVAPTSQKSPVV